MTIELIKKNLIQLSENILGWATSPNFYIQISMIFFSIFFAYILASVLIKLTPLLREKPKSGALLQLRNKVHEFGNLLFPIFNILALGLSVGLCSLFEQQNWLVRIAQSLGIIFLFYNIASQFIKNNFIKQFITWIVIPISVLQAFGWLENITIFLDSVALHIGNIRFSAYSFARLLVFGVLLFWLGRLSNTTGQQIIRSQKNLDNGTREVFSKLFQVFVVMVVFILLLQIMGINLTTLAVFGGALGVGLGFSSQAIASNFISGIIILLDRSLDVGDYIQLEDGQTGTIRQLNMRYAILETYDGKDIMVPNEHFISTTFINWTHKNLKQRYPINFTVAYDTDLDMLFKIVREVVASHPQVISGDDVPIEERPDAEIAGFTDSGIDILVEFWMENIDDGKNRVGADLLHMIWNALNKNNIEIPYPQREIKILNEEFIHKK